MNYELKQLHIENQIHFKHVEIMNNVSYRNVIINIICIQSTKINKK